MWEEFKKFAMRGNVMDMAIGIIIGTAFGAIIKALVDGILMPPLGLLLGDVDFADLFVLLQAGNPVGPYASLAQAQEAGAVVISYGVFINTIINFLIIALVMFLLVRGMNRLKKEEELAPATTKECPYCLSTIPLQATRCPQCTSELRETT
ncbi:MAG: large conductance mechanosensitive channel protein MscL [Chloroflexia bacterium]|nr:large conductance mechanosensitive channel protein MscL [Chloroflexia bacterium]